MDQKLKIEGINEVELAIFEIVAILQNGSRANCGCTPLRFLGVGTSCRPDIGNESIDMPDKELNRPSDERALARWNNEGGAPRSGDLSARTRPKRRVPGRRPQVGALTSRRVPKKSHRKGQ
jgi:hypothetical protein